MQAQRPDELSIQTDEELEVLEWDDGDGWSKGRNQSGKDGYFPQTYVRAVSPSSSPRSSVQHVQQMINSHLSGPLQDLGSEVSQTIDDNMYIQRCYVIPPHQSLHGNVEILNGTGLSNGDAATPIHTPSTNRQGITNSSYILHLMRPSPLFAIKCTLLSPCVQEGKC